METKKENVTQTPQNSKAQMSNHHDHTNCQCHAQDQEYVNFKNDERGPRRTKFFAKAVFIPSIMIKIFTSYILYIKYYCKDLRNEIDINYSRFAITIFATWLYISYFMSVLTSPEQTNVNKYTSLNKEKCNNQR